MKSILIGAIAFSLISTSSFAADAKGKTIAADAKGKTIVDVAVGAGTFGTLVTALKAADLVDTLNGPGPFTVFAPTDAAFAKIPKATLDALLADKTKLKSVLTYHVVFGKVMAADVVKLTSAKSVLGADIKITAGKDVILNGSTKVTQTDIGASNGVIHVIDTVLMPPADMKSK